MRIHFIFPAFIFLLLFSSGTAWTGEPPFTVTILNEHESFRSNSIITLRLQIDNHTPHIREGVLETTLSGTLMPLIHGIPLTLVLGINSRVVILPPTLQVGGEAQVRFRFIEGGKSIEAGTVKLSSSSSTRTHVVLLVTSEQKAHDSSTFLQLERLTAKQNGNISPRTAFSTLRAEELPQNPLAYFAYDIVALNQRTLATAKAKSLDALAHWVDAGGSVFIHLTDESQIPEAAQTFLAHLRIDEAPGSSGGFTSPGLGRAVVWRQSMPAEGSATPEWDKAAMWLWKTSPELITRKDSRSYYNEEKTGNALRQKLSEKLSTGARALPFGMVAGMFLGFVIAAVAADYFLLGRKYRKFTWILFPLECVAFAWALMAFANHRMGINERSEAIVLTDIGIDGRVLRETKITAYLPGSDGPGEHAASGAISTPDRSDQWSSYFYRATMNAPVIPRYLGNLGGAMTIQTQRSKWTPCFFRDTRLQGGLAAPDLAWAKWESSKTGTTPPDSGYEITRVSGNDTVSPGIRDLARLFTTHEASWNRAEPVSQYSPNAGAFSLEDLIFPLKGNDRDIIIAVKTVGTTTHVFRKIVRNRPPQ